MDHEQCAMDLSGCGGQSGMDLNGIGGISDNGMTSFEVNTANQVLTDDLNRLAERLGNIYIYIYIYIAY